VRRYVAVVGPAEANDEELALAREVGGLLAAAGCIVLTGGLGGVMAAAAQGADAAGGTAVGLLPGPDRREAAEHLAVAIPTGLGQARNALVVGSADGVIAIGGSWGTLSEVALAARTGRPVVSIGGWWVQDTRGVRLDMLAADGAAEAVRLLLGRLESVP
jgi:uncharacterized protein (TIGR00725 family)